MLSTLRPVFVAILATPLTALGAEPVMPTAGLAQVIGSLLAVIVLIFFLAWGLKRMQSVSPGTGGVIRIVSALPVGTRERLVLVQVGDEQILVGIGQGGMRTLHVLGSPVPTEPAGDALSPFAARLRGLLGGQTS